MSDNTGAQSNDVINTTYTDIYGLEEGKWFNNGVKYKTSSNMPLFDTRVYRKLEVYENKNTSLVNTFYPHYDYGSYSMDFYQSPGSIQHKIEEAENLSEDERGMLTKQREYVEKFRTEKYMEYLAPRSFVHPYALVKLAGASGGAATVGQAYTFDQYDRRKFYEIDGGQYGSGVAADYSGNYSKTPTTSTLIRWGTESPKGKTPYSFQDFVFCKWWNKIENNRLITLRRYAMPVTDNIEFADYDLDQNAKGDDVGKFSRKILPTKKGEPEKIETFSGTNSNSPWVPLATAVTYFGDDTGNKLSELLNFSASYNWESIDADKNPIDINASTIDAQDPKSANIISSEGSVLDVLSSGLGWVTKGLGFLGEITDGKTINLDGAGSVPPDPYSNGPYENRILGPVNVISNTYKRKRGLTFSGEGLKVTFEYVSRPIAGINNKAVILDLLANMLVLTYSSGTWFGGMWRFKADKPSVYPFKYGDTMTKLYQGKLWGKDGAVSSLTHNIFADAGRSLSVIVPDVMNLFSSFKGMLSGLVSAVTNVVTGKGVTAEDQGAIESNFNKMFDTKIMQGISKVMAAKALKGTTIPFIQNQRALLTGEPVGDWHLTIGNPLNPIAMIGNLIVKNLDVTFSDELGPDDFPIGFKAVVTLDHGLGRDRDAIESMFNRGYGRIYTLSDHFRSSADRETRVDEHTGTGDAADGNRINYDERRNMYYGGGTRFIAKVQEGQLKNKGALYDGQTRAIESLKPINAEYASQDSMIARYYVNPWMMGYIM